MMPEMRSKIWKLEITATKPGYAAITYPALLMQDHFHALAEVVQDLVSAGWYSLSRRVLNINYFWSSVASKRSGAFQKVVLKRSAGVKIAESFGGKERAQ